MDNKIKYLEFYKCEFGVAKYCSKSWGLASYEAGAQSKQAEIDELKSRLKAINEYQELIYNELMKHDPNIGFMLNKLEDIDDLSKGTTNER